MPTEDGEFTDREMVIILMTTFSFLLTIFVVIPSAFWLDTTTNPDLTFLYLSPITIIILSELIFLFLMDKDNGKKSFSDTALDKALCLISGTIIGIPLTLILFLSGAWLQSFISFVASHAYGIMVRLGYITLMASGFLALAYGNHLLRNRIIDSHEKKKKKRSKKR